MKTYNLIKLLSPKDIVAIDSLVKDKGRDSLMRLWKAVLKQDFSDKKAQLFKLTFQDTYSKERDYLLRNELRLLNEVITQYIVEVDTLKKYKHSVFILYRMLEMGHVIDFENLWDEQFKTAELIKDYTLISELLQLKIKYGIKFKDVSLKTYEVLQNLAFQKKEVDHLFALEQTAKNDILINHSTRVLKSLYPQLSKDSRHYEPDEVDRLILLYYSIKAESYSVEDSERISKLEELIVLLPKIEQYRPELMLEMPTLLASIALAYFLQHNFLVAHQYYQRAVSLIDDKSMHVDLLFNYCVNLIMVEEYETCIALNIKFRDIIFDSEKLMHRFLYFNAIAYLFIDKANFAFNLLTNDITKRPANEYYYYRMVYAMVYHQLGDFDNAHRELTNIKQSMRFRSDAQLNEKPLLNLLLNLVTLHAQRVNALKFKKELKKVVSEYKSLEEHFENSSIVILRWVEIQLKKYGSEVL